MKRSIRLKPSTVLYCGYCEHCSNGMVVRREALKRRFCSTKCRYLAMGVAQREAANPSWKGAKVERRCRICVTRFLVYRSSTKQTCSRRCDSERRRITQLRERSHRWKGGRTSLVMTIRNSALYTAWRKTVFGRDDHTCFLCQRRGGRLTAHHISPFASDSVLALEPANGITLCWPCHKGIKSREGEYEDRFYSHTTQLRWLHISCERYTHISNAASALGLEAHFS
jgi:5-methylcytosine-specific restriction endonuclease McrA